MSVTIAVTFPVRYEYEPHPVEPKADPRGYWVFEAADWMEARTAAFSRLGQWWAFDYDFDSPEFQADIARWYPAGELGRTRVDRTVDPETGAATISIEDVHPATWGVDTFDDYPEGQG